MNCDFDGVLVWVFFEGWVFVVVVMVVDFVLFVDGLFVLVFVIGEVQWVMIVWDIFDYVIVGGGGCDLLLLVQGIVLFFDYIDGDFFFDVVVVVGVVLIVWWFGVGEGYWEEVIGIVCILVVWLFEQLFVYGIFLWVVVGLVLLF